MLLVAGLVIIRPVTNPKKRIYEALYLAVRRRKDTYLAIDYVVEEVDEKNHQKDGEVDGHIR